MLKPKRGRTMSEPTPRHPPSRGTLPPAHPQSGLIVTPNTPTQSVETKSALDNHSHRTSSGRDLGQATVGGLGGGGGKGSLFGTGHSNGTSALRAARARGHTPASPYRG